MGITTFLAEDLDYLVDIWSVHPSKHVSIPFDLYSNLDSYEHGFWIYTDASRCVLGEASVGAAFVILDVSDETLHFGKFWLPCHVSVFHAELYAIYRALSFLKCFKGRQIFNIFSDCFSALQLLQKPITTVSLVRDIKNVYCSGGIA